MSINLTNTVIRLMGVFPFEVSERLALLLVAYRADEQGHTYMTRTELGRQTGLTAPTVRKVLGRLELMGLVSGKQLRLEVSALVAMSLRAESEKGFQSWVDKKLKTVFSSVETKTENSFQSDVKTVCTKTENGFHPIDKTNKTHSCACACDGVSPSSGQEPRMVSAETGRSEPLLVKGWEGLREFRRRYPKSCRDLQALNREWALLEAEGLDGRPVALADLLDALEAAKRSKQWLEEGGRYIPRPEVWLGERQFVALLRPGASAAEQRADLIAKQRAAADAAIMNGDDEALFGADERSE